MSSIHTVFHSQGNIDLFIYGYIEYESNNAFSMEMVVAIGAPSHPVELEINDDVKYLSNPELYMPE